MFFKAVKKPLEVIPRTYNCMILIINGEVLFHTADKDRGKKTKDISDHYIKENKQEFLLKGFNCLDFEVTFIFNKIKCKAIHFVDNYLQSIQLTNNHEDVVIDDKIFQKADVYFESIDEKTKILIEKGKMLVNDFLNHLQNELKTHCLPDRGYKNFSPN